LAYQTCMIQKVSRMIGWLTLTFIAYATLSPIDARPTIGTAHFEHFVAFGLEGLALGIGYPKRPLWVAAIVIGSALVLEGLQLLTPDRHARLLDALVKAAGGLCGIGIGQFAAVIFRYKFGGAR
jgi:VanZ family protein